MQILLNFIYLIYKKKNELKEYIKNLLMKMKMKIHKTVIALEEYMYIILNVEKFIIYVCYFYI